MSHSEDSEQEDAVIAALLAYHRRKQPKPAAAGEYERIRAHFERRAERLHAERLLTRELVTRLLEGSKNLPPRPRHQELELSGRAGASASGRVRVRNRSKISADYELIVVGPADTIKLTLEPRSGRLAASESQLVRVSADLRTLAPGESATLALECRWPDGRDRIWLTIRAENQR